MPTRDGQLDTNVLQQARYFDCMNFAMRVKAGACFGFGFIDTVCPPSSSYAALNGLPGKNKVINEPLKAHEGSPRMNEAFVAAINAEIRKRQNEPIAFTRALLLKAICQSLAGFIPGEALTKRVT